MIEDDDGERLDQFAVLMQERAEVVGMQLQEGTDYLRGWRALMAAGLARLLVADHDGELVGGLFLFRQGGIWATAYSADEAARRRDLPGTMHLVRGHGHRGGARRGLPGHRARRCGPARPPGATGAGDPNRGLYEHKRGFGAQWVEREPARRIVLRPGAERAGAPPAPRHRRPARDAKIAGMASDLERLRTDDAAWDAFVEGSDTAFPLQMTAWAAAKAPYGWTSAPRRGRRRLRAHRRPGADAQPGTRPVLDGLHAARPGGQRLRPGQPRCLHQRPCASSPGRGA